MWMTLFSLLKMIWPFFKEAVLEGGTVRNWIAKNKMTSAFMAMLTIMFLAVLMMADLVIKIRHEVATLRHEKTELIYRYNGLVGRYNSMRREKLQCGTNLATSEQRLARLRILVADSCPEDSAAYRTLVAGIESLDYPVEIDSVRWCEVVKEEDLEVEAIRQRYLRDCQ